MSLTLNLAGLSMRGDKTNKISFTKEEELAAKQVVSRILKAADIACTDIGCPEAVEEAIAIGMNNPKNKDNSLSGICRHGLETFIETQAKAGTAGFPKADRDYGSVILMLRSAAKELKVDQKVVDTMFPSYYKSAAEKAKKSA
jgi:hypothetical protein